MAGSTERINRLRERYMATIPRVDAERAILATRAYQETEGEPMVIRRAKTLKKIFEEASICISFPNLR
jgi:pyruvate-formate lyase